jgi:glyoxylase-like metal-dependent hydrolase (beta-lactamase superfamily II)
MEQLSITPIHCGTLNGVERSSQQYLVGCGEHIDVPLVMWLIEGGEHPVVVDLGAGTPDIVAAFQGRELQQARPPVDTLLELGVDPSDVEAVILTHAHWDHVLGIESSLFPRAKHYIQQRELDFAVNPVPPQRGLYHPKLVSRLTGDVSEDVGEIVAVDGDYTVAPGVEMIFTPGHTPGTSAVLVRTKRGTFGISSDTVALGSSLRGTSWEEWHAPGIHVDVRDCYASMKRLQQEADVVLPSHDAAVFAQARYP